MKKKCVLILLIFAIITFQSRAASRNAVRARNSMVATVHELATRTAIDVLQRGNAMDAAVAALFTLAVVWPEAGNLGGGTFFLVRTADGKTEFIDAREVAPKTATREMYVGKGDASTIGYQSIAVPGAVAGLGMLHERYGSMKWSELVEPARKLAADGFNVSFKTSQRMEEHVKTLKMFPESSKTFLRNGQKLSEGQRFFQPNLAATLKRIQEFGAKEFYQGQTATMIVDEMRKNGGLLTAEDLSNYKPVIRKPLTGTYKTYTIETAPPPSSGGIALLQILKMLQSYDLKAAGFQSSDELHLLVESMKRAFADRSKFSGDPEFTNVPVDMLLSSKHIDELRSSIQKDRATPSKEVLDPAEVAKVTGNTTHISIIDRFGNIVAATTTLNESYGSGVTVSGAGFLLNDEMDDFTTEPGKPNLYGLIQGEGNSIEPGKRPASSMTPTIVLKDNKPFMILGSPGGSRIPTAVAQCIINVVDFGMEPQQAVDAPRIHHQWFPDEIFWESLGLNADVRKILEQRGHVFAKEADKTGSDVHLVMIDPVTGMKLGAADPRRGGFALGN
jgi:gamma-glutamyltranspeptidase/glutathione hydrolase